MSDIAAAGAGQVIGRLLGGPQPTLADFLAPGRFLTAEVVSVFEDRAILSLARGVLLEVRLQTPLAERQHVALQVAAQQGAMAGTDPESTVVLRFLGQVREKREGAQQGGPRTGTQAPVQREGAGVPRTTAADIEAGGRRAGPLQTDIPAGRTAPPPPPRAVVYEPPTGWRDQAPQEAGRPAPGPAQTAPRTDSPSPTPPPTQGTAPGAGQQSGATTGGAQAPQAGAPEAAPGSAPVPGAPAATQAPVGQTPVPAAQPTPATPLPDAAQPAPQAAAPQGAHAQAAAPLAPDAGQGAPPAASQSPLPSAAAAPAAGPQSQGAPAAQPAAVPEQAAAPAAAPPQVQAPAVPVSVPGEMVAWLPIPLPGGGQGWAQIKVEEDRRRKAKRPGEQYYQIRIWWETANLGTVQVLLDAAPEGRLAGLFTVAAAALRAGIEERLPRLEEALAEAGYPAAHLATRVSQPGEQQGPAAGSNHFDRRV